MRQKVHKHAEAQQPEPDLEKSDEKRQQDRVGDKALTAGDGERLQRRGGEQRNHCNRAGRELARGTEHCPDDRGQESSV